MAAPAAAHAAGDRDASADRHQPVQRVSPPLGHAPQIRALDFRNLALRLSNGRYHLLATVSPVPRDGASRIMKRSIIGLIIAGALSISAAARACPMCKD